MLITHEEGGTIIIVPIAQPRRWGLQTHEWLYIRFYFELVQGRIMDQLSWFPTKDKFHWPCLIWAGDSLASSHCDSCNDIALQGATAILIFLEFSGVSFNLGFGTPLKVSCLYREGKKWKMVHLRHFLQNNASPLLRSWFCLIPHHLMSLAGCTSWCCLPMGTAVARSFGNYKEEFWPHEEPMCSPPPSMLLFLDGGTKISIEEYHEKLPERLLCPSPRSLFQNV